MKKRKSASNEQKAQRRSNNQSTRLSIGRFCSSRRAIAKSSLGISIAIASGAWLHHHDTTNKRLHNLDVIGAGKPVVLQVHDPSCPSCRQLMRAAKTALKSLPDFEYRIADLTTSKGAEISSQYNVGKVTLLLFDAGGRHVRTIQGVTPATQLHDIISNELTPEL